MVDGSAVNGVPLENMNADSTSWRMWGVVRQDGGWAVQNRTSLLVNPQTFEDRQSAQEDADRLNAEWGFL